MNLINVSVDLSSLLKTIKLFTGRKKKVAKEEKRENENSIIKSYKAAPDYMKDIIFELVENNNRPIIKRYQGFHPAVIDYLSRNLSYDKFIFSTFAVQRKLEDGDCGVFFLQTKYDHVDFIYEFSIIPEHFKTVKKIVKKDKKDRLFKAVFSYDLSWYIWVKS